MRTISVIIVDDSAFMRTSLSKMLESDPQIKVVATAKDGREGIEKIRQFKPDVVTMDIEMPGMDGLTALGILMKELPVPVLMISSLTTDGAKATLDALNLGAVDFIPKDLSYVSLDIVKIKEDLIAKVKHIAQSKSLQLRLSRIQSAAREARGVKPAEPAPRSGTAPSLLAAVRAKQDLQGVVLGISTGGPFALMQTIPKLPGGFPLGMAIVQHMPPRFTKSLAERLDGLSEVTVKEAENGEPMQPGVVLIAPGGEHLTLVNEGRRVVARTSPEPSTTLYRPSADVMILSAVKAFSGPLLGLIMTGMGKDGLEGIRALKAKGGIAAAQSEESCVVYGMPKAIVEERLADYVLPLEEVPRFLSKVTGSA